MKFSKQDRGVAGLNVFLGVVVLLFIIGFLIMIFSIMGGKVEENVWSSSSGTTTNETVTVTDLGTGVSLARQADNEPTCTVTVVNNATGGESIPSTNYTVTECVIASAVVASSGDQYNNSNWNVTYTYSTKVNNTASGIIYDTSDSLADTTDWFGIIIVITAMVVLILLTVMIITAIRGSGLVAGGSTSMPRTSA